jgi:hypothetical protein
MVTAANVSDIGVSCTVNSPGCGAAQDMGSVNGDAFGTVDAGYIARTGTGQAWFRLGIVESSSALTEYLAVRINLGVPSGVDYDLNVYCTSCDGSLIRSSTLPGSDGVVVGWPDRAFFDDGGYVLIEVRYKSGGSSTNWTLTVNGSQVVYGGTPDDC